MPEDFRRLFGPEGPLAKRLEGFQPRSGQAAMAEAVASAIENLDCLIVEAGTGTGKTLAYLVPALLSGRKLLISTGTKALQEQLFDKDLPVARAALDLPVRVALLKGRANYLCLHRLDLAQQQGRARPPAQLSQLRRIREWSVRTHSGDLAEIGDIADGSPIWPQVSSTADNCLGSECPRLADCHPLRARRQALEADVVVVNHHLFFADLAVKQGGFGELLPQADAVILDEAHQVPEIASLFFSTGLSARQLDDLARDIRAEYAVTGSDTPELELCLRENEAAIRHLDQVLGPQPTRAAWSAALESAEAAQALERLRAKLADLETQLEALAPRTLGLASCYLRCKACIERLDSLVAGSRGVVRWVEKFAQGFALNATPLDIAGRFRQLMEAHPAAWIFTSATLAVKQGFEHFSARLGLEEPRTLVLDSPFDYRRNALLYIPRGLPDPAAPDYTQAVVQAALPLIHASEGGAFLLCTSHRALQEAAALLRPQLGSLPLLVQGESGRGELLARFRAAGNAVLIGTSSFWEGVDVRGTALRLVIIDKLPFGSPGEPVLQARLEALREQGEDPFRSHQLPQAVIALKQGAGRLIRDATDRGVLMLCDPRLLSRPYGKTFLGSLPPMPLSHDLQRACDFFRQQAVA
ncbi:MAG TPA: ATP-dependent DNA helicase [Nevskiales bacterium]|nr:ATP-dependent DNA helicase [Nevskiales bacterium]